MEKPWGLFDVLMVKLVPVFAQKLKCSKPQFESPCSWVNAPAVSVKVLVARGSFASQCSPTADSSEHPGASKPPLSSSSMTSRILLRQQLMREQMQEQERREQQQKQQAAQFMQQRVPLSQTPAINVSVPCNLPPPTQVPMEVLKVHNLGYSLIPASGCSDTSNCQECILGSVLGNNFSLFFRMQTPVIIHPRQNPALFYAGEAREMEYKEPFLSAPATHALAKEALGWNLASALG
ncbi:Microphthalmia-associated transcription factor [Chelonia mydas]|uniref:Microphthalmia-associated transcription factor n=1 Tax=Chelonia mydas TaxID=8469 RepID=M7B8B3_CHEMY|nr:Microphthalmia-associated transcription factor [Chelonia mydas]